MAGIQGKFYTSEGDDSGIVSQVVNFFTTAQIFDVVKFGLLIYFVILALVTMCSKNSPHKDATDLRQRLYKRFIYANYEIIQCLEDNEKTEMLKTFENTVKNAQRVEITPKEVETLQAMKNSARKEKKTVEINLDKNQVYKLVDPVFPE